MGKYDGVSSEDTIDDLKRSRLSKSDWQGWLAPLSLQNTEGLCTKTRKCVLKDGHAHPCWPGD